MTGNELDKLLVELNLNSCELSRLLCVDVRTVRRWTSNHSPISKQVEKHILLLAILLRGKFDLVKYMGENNCNPFE